LHCNLSNLKIPRNTRGYELVKMVAVPGYVSVRQTGSHRGIKTERNHEHAETIANHGPIKIGTFNKILSNIAEHFKISKEELINTLF